MMRAMKTTSRARWPGWLRLRLSYFKLDASVLMVSLRVWPRFM